MEKRDYFLLIGLASLFFIPYLGGVHLFDWDEINFAECAREMIRTGEYFRPQIDFEPFWEKPPLFLWMQASAMHLFGVNEFAARFPNAVCGLATILLVYHLGKRMHDRTMGMLWSFAWLGSILPHLYFRSGIIDPWFNLFIFGGLYGFIAFRWQFFASGKHATWWLRYRYLIFGGLSLGLAILTKGPTAYLIVLLVLMAYWAMRKFRSQCYIQHVALFSLAAVSVSLVWFGVEIALHGPWFIQEFIVYQIRLFTTQDAGHGGFFGYHFVVLLLGCFPISVFALANLVGDKQCEDELNFLDPLRGCKQSDFATWMQILFWVVLILFSIVRTKIVHYSSLAYFPITYLGALTIWRAIFWDIKPKIVAYVLPTFGLLIGGVSAAIPYLGQHLDWIKPLFARDQFALQNLQANVHWELWQGWPGIVLVLASFISTWYWNRNRAWESAQVIFAGGAIFVLFTLLFYIRNIEAYSQAAAIEFFESKAQEDCYIRTWGYKSYAHLFYSNKRPLTSTDHSIDDLDALLHQPQTKPVYIVAKLTNIAQPPEIEGFRELYRKNGFVFFEKK